MVHRFTSCILVAVLLACPHLCRAGIGCCAAEGVAAQQACCEHCLPAHRSDGDDDTSTPEKSPETCPNSCLCKGALIESVNVVTPPEVDFLADASPTHGFSVDASTNVLCRIDADYRRECGAGLRIALCSLLC